MCNVFNPLAAKWPVLMALALLAALAGCGASGTALPSFPEYPPAKVYLEDQDDLRDRVHAQEAHAARVRLYNQTVATERANAMWRRSEILQAQRRRELLFRESIRRQNEQRHFQELQEFQSLQ